MSRFVLPSHNLIQTLRGIRKVFKCYVTLSCGCVDMNFRILPNLFFLYRLMCKQVYYFVVKTVTSLVFLFLTFLSSPIFKITDDWKEILLNMMLGIQLWKQKDRMT